MKKIETELNTLIAEIAREEAGTDLKKDRVKTILSDLGLAEHTTPTGESAKLAIYEELKCDEGKARELLDKATFARLFPQKADNATIKKWAASDPDNKALFEQFSSTRQQSPRLSIKAAK